MTRDERLSLIREIEKRRGSKVVVYVTSDRPGLSYPINPHVVSLLHEHILEIEKGKRTKLDLFLYSRGGDSDTPWSIVSMFREYCKEGSFSVLIPYRAHSAATLISLGADEIVMGKKGELGPIDITINRGPYNPTDKNNEPLPVSVEDVSGYFKLLDKIGCASSEEKMTGFTQLSGQVHPLVLGTVSRLSEQTKLVALRLLTTRAKAFTEEKNKQIADRLSSEIFSHNHSISRSEALKHLELSQIVMAEDAKIEEEMWALHAKYREWFQFENPFKPEEEIVAEDREEKTWSDLPLACVESEKRLDVFRQDLRVRRLRQIPPQVNLNLNLNNLAPAINVPNLPVGVQPNQVTPMVQAALQGAVQGALQGVVENAARQAADQLAKSLPTAGFERFAFKSGWKKEM